MAPWAREGGKTSENRQRKSEGEKSDKVEAHLSKVIVGNLRRFRATLIESTQGLPKRRRLRGSIGKLENTAGTVL